MMGIHHQDPLCLVFELLNALFAALLHWLIIELSEWVWCCCRLTAALSSPPSVWNVLPSVVHPICSTQKRRLFVTTWYQFSKFLMGSPSYRQISLGQQGVTMYDRWASSPVTIFEKFTKIQDPPSLHSIPTLAENEALLSSRREKSLRKANLRGLLPANPSSQKKRPFSISKWQFMVKRFTPKAGNGSKGEFMKRRFKNGLQWVLKSTSITFLLQWASFNFTQAY